MNRRARERSLSVKVITTCINNSLNVRRKRTSQQKADCALLHLVLIFTLLPTRKRGFEDGVVEASSSSGYGSKFLPLRGPGRFKLHRD